MGRKSKTKGSNFERKIANQIREALGAPKDRVTRTPLSGGMYERGDVIIKEPYQALFPWFMELRNRESWGTFDTLMKSPTSNVPLKWFLEDAVGKCHPYDGRLPRKPVLIFTRNQAPVYAMFYLVDLRDLPPKPNLFLTDNIVTCLWDDFLAQAIYEAQDVDDESPTTS